jgi:hypothetical protein
MSHTGIFSTKNQGKLYEKVVTACKARKKGATPADIAADTGLPLNTVRELVPKAADEFSGRLEVTESGEILYSFPKGFNSRYRGFVPFWSNFFKKFIHFSMSTGTFLFKIWIMIMLLGYFALFMAIAFASLFLSVAASSSNNRSRRGGNTYLSMGIFNLIIRLWFYSELTRSFSGQRNERAKPKSKPLHRAIFSFVFGDGDPNGHWNAQEKKAFIAFLQEHKGVISLPEFMALTGLKPDEAEAEIIAFCVEFNGSPEATEDGTVVYRFDEILLRSDPKREKKSGLPLLIKSLRAFSSNPKNMNWWFSVINAVNLLFGAYFLYNGVAIGHGILGRGRGIYWLVYTFIYSFANPLPIIIGILGIVPLAFSVLFWLVPFLRGLALRKENEKIHLENFRRFSFGRIWNSPLLIKKTDLKPVYHEAGFYNLKEAQDKVIKEMGVYSIPNLTLDDAKNELYSFVELDREKQALEKYRASINPEASSLGKTIFDSAK